MRAGLRLLQGAQALPKALHTGAERSESLVSETDRDWSQQGWVLRNTAPCKSWSGSKEKQRSGPTGNSTQSLRRNCQGNQTTAPKQENNSGGNGNERREAPEASVQSVLGASVSARAQEGTPAFHFPAAEAVGCCRDGETASWSAGLWILLFMTILEQSALPMPRCSGGVCAWSKSQARLPPLPHGSYHPFLLCSPFHDFTSSQSWSVESSTSDSPTSIAIISEISESLLTAGSCSPGRREQSAWWTLSCVFRWCFLFSSIVFNSISL